MQTEACMWKLVLAYDGSEFHGWQVQPDRVTVQGELRDALARITGEDVLPQGSGRTDAGVHALGQVASFALAAPIPEANLARALNRTLPASIRVLSAARVGSDFHARHSAQAKTYEYKIFRGELCPPWQARYVYAYNAPLNVDAMQRAAARVVGEHDFTSFAASDSDSGDNVRCLDTSQWMARAPTTSLSSAGQWLPPSHGAQPGGNLSRSGTGKYGRERNSGDSRFPLSRARGPDGAGTRIVPCRRGLPPSLTGSEGATLEI